MVQPSEEHFIADEQVANVIGGGFGGDSFESNLGADAGDVAEGDSEPAFHWAWRRGPGWSIIGGLVDVTDEGLFLEAVDPLFLQDRLLLDAKRFFDVVANLTERSGVRRPFLVHFHKIDGIRGIQRFADLARGEGKRDLAEFGAEHGTFHPAPIAA